MSLDEWSNIRNEPIVCISVMDELGNTFVVETVDTSGESHTGEYLYGLTVNCIKKVEEKYRCEVKSFVTDNASNMVKMRDQLLKTQDSDLDHSVLAYGCSSHWLNLLSKDLEVKGIKEHIVSICKYFRNTHLPAAWYKAEKITRLVL
ncbi:hypothetical protein SNE40_021181 [Patella caerulea]|uniref:DUF659 domain-containing protein n=1 Tax=Patella caerulea TaxID=87958 RepID=A0AAN8J478_PATCE